MNADMSSASQAHASQAKDNASDLQARVAKVEQQAHKQASGAKGVDALGAMDLSYRLDGLQLHDHRLVNQQVHRVITDDGRIVRYGNTALLQHRQAGLAKFMRKRIFIHLLQKPSPKTISPSYSPHSRDSLTGMVQTSGIA